MLLQRDSKHRPPARLCLRTQDPNPTPLDDAVNQTRLSKACSLLMRDDEPSDCQSELTSLATEQKINGPLNALRRGRQASVFQPLPSQSNTRRHPAARRPDAGAILARTSSIIAASCRGRGYKACGTELAWQTATTPVATPPRSERRIRVVVFAPMTQAPRSERRWRSSCATDQKGPRAAFSPLTVRNS